MWLIPVAPRLIQQVPERERQRRGPKERDQEEVDGKEKEKDRRRRRSGDEDQRSVCVFGDRTKRKARNRAVTFFFSIAWFFELKESREEIDQARSQRVCLKRQKEKKRKR